MANRYKLAIALAPLVLAACGGGGGGSSVRPTVYTPINGTTTSANLFGLSSNFVADIDTVGNPAGTPNLASRTGTVQGSATFNSSGVPTVVNLDVAITSGPSFQQSFSSLSSFSLAGASNGSANATLYGQVLTAPSDSSIREVIILDPSSIGLSYSTLGSWNHATGIGATTFHGGNFIIGVRTSPGDIPSSGTAAYSGVMVGTYARRGVDIYQVAAQASATATFNPGNATVTFQTTGTRLTSLTTSAVTNPGTQLDISGTLSYSAINNLTGTFSLANSPSTSGPASARFFGPAARELGGTFHIEHGTGAEQMSGAFALKR